MRSRPRVSLAFAAVSVVAESASPALQRRSPSMPIYAALTGTPRVRRANSRTRPERQSGRATSCGRLPGEPATPVPPAGGRYSGSRVTGGISAPAPTDPGVTVSRHRALLIGPNTSAPSANGRTDRASQEESGQRPFAFRARGRAATTSKPSASESQTPSRRTLPCSFRLLPEPSALVERTTFLISRLLRSPPTRVTDEWYHQVGEQERLVSWRLPQSVGGNGLKWRCRTSHTRRFVREPGAHSPAAVAHDDAVGPRLR
jgi:hypothetical protein